MYIKLAVKEVAASLGLQASFLAKTNPGEEGSSGHVHLSCWANGQNAFATADPASESPQPFSAAIAGMLDHLPAASLMLNPTINSYKRLVPGWFAPVNVSWGIENRSAAVRAIRSERPERCRIECRRPGADANPYLALAALVASARGDAAQSPRRRPCSGTPPSGAICPRCQARSRARCGLRRRRRPAPRVGETFSDYFAVSREWELKAWRDAVSDWERARYGNVV